jgi:hypothetical protein
VNTDPRLQQLKASIEAQILTARRALGNNSGAFLPDAAPAALRVLEAQLEDCERAIAGPQSLAASLGLPG